MVHITNSDQLFQEKLLIIFKKSEYLQSAPKENKTRGNKGVALSVAGALYQHQEVLVQLQNLTYPAAMLLFVRCLIMFL